MRNLGVPMGHSVIALRATMKGVGKLLLNEAKLQADLDANWAIVAEPSNRPASRRLPKPYEALKDLTRAAPLRK